MQKNQENAVPFFLLVKTPDCDITSIQKKELKMAEVKIETNRDFEKALRGFKLQCKREGIVKRCRERQYYTKPSQKRREKAKNKKR